MTFEIQRLVDPCLKYTRCYCIPNFTSFAVLFLKRFLWEIVNFFPDNYKTDVRTPYQQYLEFNTICHQVETLKFKLFYDVFSKLSPMESFMKKCNHSLEDSFWKERHISFHT